MLNGGVTSLVGILTDMFLYDEYDVFYLLKKMVIPYLCVTYA